MKCKKAGLSQKSGIPLKTDADNKWHRKLCNIYKKPERNMKKLALDDTILLKIEKPARYIGNEVNMVVKDPAEVEIRAVFCFPDVFERG